MSKDILENAISDGVDGVFGLGSIENDTVQVKFFNEQAMASFESGEALIHKSLCRDKEKQTKHQNGNIVAERGQASKPHHPVSTGVQSINKDLDRLAFRFSVPEGQVNTSAKYYLTLHRITST